MEFAGLKIIRHVNCLFAFVLPVFAYNIVKSSIDIALPRENGKRVQEKVYLS